MAQIFISYRRSDSTTMTGRIYDRIRQEFGKEAIFKDVDNIPAGRDFRGVLREATANCGVMLVIIGPSWVNAQDAAGNRRLYDTGDFVRLEVETGLQRDDVRVIPVLVNNALPPRAADLPDSLKELAYNNALSVRDDPDFHRDMDRLIEQLKPQIKRVSKLRPSNIDWRWIIAAIFIPLLAALITIIPSLMDKAKNATITLTAQGTEIIATPVLQAQAATLDSSILLTSTPTPTSTELDIGLLVGTLDSQATQSQATQDIQATSAAQATEYAVGTQSLIHQTETATLWTFTPTANVTASIEAYRTQQAQIAAVNQTATAELWTKTPTPTATSTNTNTPISVPTTVFTPSVSPLNTSTTSPTLEPEEQTLQIALTRIVDNADWTPIERDFDGVTMVLVPVGCFMMGTANGPEGEGDEKPANNQCILTPYWIDKYEVTNAQFESLNGVAANNSNWRDAELPRERISWFEARDYCIKRGARLPTEREWEYAARGPDSLVYPWGDDWNENNAVFGGNSNQKTKEGGSYPNGASWVGAQDMAGNVWEFVNTIYGIEKSGYYNFVDVGERIYSYPYTDDVREQDFDSRTYVRVIRGGSWYDTFSSLRSAERSWKFPDFQSYVIGFRCAHS